jgi:hypothetical protein
MSIEQSYTFDGPVSINSGITEISGTPAEQETQPWRPDSETVGHVINCIAIPNLRVVLGNVLGAIDASIPNKEQNKAVKHIVRTSFDEAYYDILRRAYPDFQFGSGGGYAIEPEVNRGKAFTHSLVPIAQGSAKD